MRTPLLGWSSFTGVANFQTHELNIDFVVVLGHVYRSIPATKRFVGHPIREVFDWYNRHPDALCTFTQQEHVDTIGPSPWRATPRKS
jgi:hypothetical protein